MLQICSGATECLTLYIKIKISYILLFARLGRLAFSRVSTIIVEMAMAFIRGKEERLSIQKSVSFFCLRSHEPSDKLSKLVYSFSRKVNATHEILHIKYRNHSFFRSCNLRSTFAVRDSLRKPFLK